MDALYPTFDICGLETNKVLNDLLNADRFQGYVKRNPHTHRVHKHSFYHLVFFTNGGGKHILDFETYPIRKGIIYFMRPDQVHNWLLDEEADGYVINFSPIFFERLSIGHAVLDTFPFFNLFSSNQVIELNEKDQQKVTSIFEEVLVEVKDKSDSNLTPIHIASLLLQLFTISARTVEAASLTYSYKNYNSILLKKFIELIEVNFKELKLPKEYASMLYVTTNHLNLICQDQMQVSAGELIRKRVLLEAKRLLINFELTISSIALELNFFDTSYFVKFFKKHTGLTPEAFRREYYQKK